MVVGQIGGGAVQGHRADALGGWCTTAKVSQLVSPAFMDYARRRAPDLIAFETDGHLPCPAAPISAA